ncbi:hypothetical protein PMZ80_007511 [Knufia obscura]|nr:hypothetical protein PMZ80_007511 [Knufia obscura]
MVEKTVTSCNLLELATNCKPILPTGRPWGKRSEEEEYYAMAMAEYENDLEKRQFGGFNFSNNPAFTWLSVLAKGSDSVKSVCSCIQTPSKTVTTTVTAKATGN